jgi:serine/threonine-protein kinase RsbT
MARSASSSSERAAPGQVRVTRVPLRDDADIAVARNATRAMAADLGFPTARAEALVTAVSEIARNAVVHGGGGEMRLEVVRERRRVGMIVEVRDHGPGIRDADQAMRDGYSTAKTLGLGLSGARRLVDDFSLVTAPAAGTTVTLRQWER